MKTDFHSHILPGIDDGSRNIEESVALLDMMAEDGVETVCATPHFYSHKISIDGFINRRNEAFEKLKPHLKPEHPKILLGAEVLYNHSLIQCDELSRLCLEGTDYLLWEMPYTQITKGIVTDTEELAGSTQIKLMIAHIERYLHFTSYDELASLMSLDVIGQINCKSLTKFSSRRQVKKLISDGYVHLLGTDYHRTDSGHELLGVAEKFLTKMYGEKIVSAVYRNSRLVLENKPIYELDSL